MPPITLEKLTEVLTASNKPFLDRQEELLKALQAGKEDKDKNDSPITMAQLHTMVTEGKVVEPGGKKVTLEDLEQTAQMGATGIGGLVNTLDGAVRGLPIGSALIGGGSAFFVSEIVDGFVPKGDPINLLVKGGVAWGGVTFFRRLLGGPAANIFGALLVFDIVKSFIPLEEWIRDFLSRLPGGGGQMTLHQGFNGYQAVDTGAGFVGSNVIPAHHGVPSSFDAIYQ